MRLTEDSIGNGVNKVVEIVRVVGLAGVVEVVEVVEVVLALPFIASVVSYCCKALFRARHIIVLNINGGRQLICAGRWCA